MAFFSSHGKKKRLFMSWRFVDKNACDIGPADDDVYFQDYDENPLYMNNGTSSGGSS